MSKTSPIATRIPNRELKFIDRHIQKVGLTRSTWLRRLIQKEVAQMKRESSLQKEYNSIREEQIQRREKAMEAIFNNEVLLRIG